MGAGKKQINKGIKDGDVDLEPIWTSAPPGRRGDTLLKGDTNIAPAMRTSVAAFFKRVGTQTVRPSGSIPGG